MFLVKLQIYNFNSGLIENCFYLLLFSIRTQHRFCRGLTRFQTIVRCRGEAAFFLHSVWLPAAFKDSCPTLCRPDSQAKQSV